MSPKKPAPLLGYNTNVRHSGELFHIQTEDSGVDHPHIITHLFVEGTILATKKHSYSLLLEEGQWEDKVRTLMKEQHKAMFIELRDGVHDEIAAKIFGAMGGGGKASEAPQITIPDEPESIPRRDSEEPTTQIERKDGQGVRVIRPASMTPASSKDASTSSTTIVIDSSRGKSIFDTPNENGEFGENLITNKSLDEVILSYLTDELEE